MQTNFGTLPDKLCAPERMSLEQWVADARYEKRVFDIAARTKMAANEAQVLQLLAMGTQALGAKFGVLMLFRATPTHRDEVQTIGGDPTWGAQHFQGDIGRHDIAIEHAQRRGAPIVVDELQLTTIEQKAVIDLAIRHGLMSLRGAGPRSISIASGPSIARFVRSELLRR